jgi:RNA polymerase sigma-70 factor (ECF subfamily)
MLSACFAARSPPRARRVITMASMPDLLSLIARDRSDAAFRRLYDEFGPRVRKYMLQQGVGADVAEELTQETLATVWQKAALYSPDKGAASTWIFTIARNLRIDRIRRQRPWQELTDEVAASIASDEPSPDTQINERQREARVRMVLDALPADQLEVVRLAFMEGLPHSEIAARLRLPLGTVKSRIRLAYNKLRSALEDLR